MTDEEFQRMMDPSWPMVLVACCGAKLAHRALAQDLYTSDLFRKSRAYAERFGHAWYILSAKHGIVPPGKVIAPYDETLARMSGHQRASWNKMVLEQWGASTRHPVVVLAGKDYRGWIARAQGTFSVPMAGMGIGRQKAWLKARLFCLSLAGSPAQVAMMVRVAQAFNSYADHDGQERRALFF